MVHESADALSVILLLARDTDRTAAFYRDVVGLPLAAEEHTARHRHYACQTGSIYFTIRLSKDLAKEAPGHGYDFLQLCFAVRDLNAFLAKLEQHTLAPLHPPRPFEHTTYITLLDPDGRHVRIMTPWME
jgi:catechol 2,3-dioxygenase-like lactoylglutathione lyase family enzyme